MSIGGIMRTSVSGMNAQATRLSGVADNIANSDTTGYKKSQTEFSSLLLPKNSAGYNSGAVDAQTRTLISQQGGLTSTGNDNNAKQIDLAVNGQGFLVVSDGDDGTFLTRAGAFTQQADGTLVNSAGFTLLGYPIDSSGTDNVLNGFQGLEPVNLRTSLLSANPSTEGELTVHLDKSKTAETVPAELPSANGAFLPKEASSTAVSMTVYNNSGEAVKLDIYYTKTSDVNNTWEVTIYDSRDAATGTATSPFPYSTAPLATATMDFDETTFNLATMTATAPASATVTDNKVLNIDLGPIGGGILKLDLGETTQFTGTQQPSARVNGNPAEVIDKISIGTDGTVTANFASGTTRDLYKIPLALVNSPDNMEALAGNVFDPGIESGTVVMGFGGSGAFGDLTAGALENSTVDLASELTLMIEAQRAYTANSKVFQTGSEILDVLVNLKR